MFLLLALSSGTVLGLVSVAVALYRAPVAYEDESGFHLLGQNPARSRVVNSGMGFTPWSRDWLLRRGLSKKPTHRKGFGSRSGSPAAEAPLGQPRRV